jgi:hypothetical protein
MTRRTFFSLLADHRATAAAEMALITPLLLILISGAVEVGNYFMNEHALAKSVRDGARFAARQSFANYPTSSCDTDLSGTVGDNTVDIVMYGYLGGTTLLVPNISDTDVTVRVTCPTAAGGQTMSGIYKNLGSGTRLVTVTADVDYRPVIAPFGFSGAGLHLYASSESTVTGL